MNTTETKPAESRDIMQDRTWIFHEGQIERIKAKDGEACALFVEENRKTINNMVFKFLRERPDMRAHFTGTNGRIELDAFYNQLILDLPYLAYDNGAYLYTTMYRDSVSKAYIGYEYIMTDAARNGNKHSALFYQCRKAPETLMPSFYDDWTLENDKGEESDRHPLDSICTIESVEEEYNKRGDRGNVLDVDELIELVSDLLNEKDCTVLRCSLQAMDNESASEELGVSVVQYKHARERALVKLRENAADVVARLLERGSRRANLFVGVFPEGYSEEEKEARRERERARHRTRRAQETPEEAERRRAKNRERVRAMRARQKAEQASAWGA